MISSGEPTTTLVVVDSGEDVGDVGALSASAFDGATVLSFNQSEAILASVVGMLPTGVTVTSGAPRVDDVAPDVSARYLRLVADVPRKYLVGEKPLIEAWEFERGESLWWLHELSGTRSDVYPTFTRLCQLEVIRRVVGSSNAGAVALVSKDAGFAAAVGSLCGVLGIEYTSPIRTVARAGLTYEGIAARLALWAGRTVVQTAMAKVLTKAIVPDRSGALPVACFHTLYPSFFISTRGAMDEKYQEVPNLVAGQGVTPFLAVTIAADDGHQHVSLGATLRACLRLRRTPSFNEIPARLIDRDLGWRGMFAGFWRGGIATLRTASLARSRGFRDLWKLDGVDIFPLIEPELRMAVYRTPRYMMHLRRMRAAVEAIGPDAVVGSLFEFCYGRATSMAIAGSRTKPLNIGVQHGPTGRKLMYQSVPGGLAAGVADSAHVPMPDHLILESEEALGVLRSSGYPMDRAHVLGAPRLDQLAGAQRWSPRTAESEGPVRVLVVFGGSDGMQIMGICKPVIEKTAGTHFIMKTHPRSSVQAEQIEGFLSGETAATYEVATEGIYDLMGTADVVVATYSSAGMEAAALGYPVIALNLPDFASPSGLMDVSGNVRFAASPGDLAAALAAAGASATADTGATERAFFSRLDGHAQERWAETIAWLTKEHSVR